MAARALIAIVALGATIACSDEPPPRAAPAATTTTTSGTTTTTIAVDVVPDEITVEYVQAVMDALDASWGDMYRQLHADGAFTPETEAWLDALYDEPTLSRIRESLGAEVDEAFDDTRPEPGNPETVLTDLMTATSDCVLVSAERRYRQVLSHESVDVTTYIVLRRSAPSTRNPTAWTITVEARPEDADAEVNDPCA